MNNKQAEKSFIYISIILKFLNGQENRNWRYLELAQQEKLIENRL